MFGLKIVKKSNYNSLTNELTETRKQLQVKKLTLIKLKQNTIVLQYCCKKQIKSIIQKPMKTDV